MLLSSTSSSSHCPSSCRRGRPHNLHFHTCVYPTVARRRVYLSVPHLHTSLSSIIIFASYIKIITESHRELTGQSRASNHTVVKLERAERHGQGHPLCWRAFICQTIQRGAGSTVRRLLGHPIQPLHQKRAQLWQSGQFG